MAVSAKTERASPPSQFGAVSLRGAAAPPVAPVTETVAFGFGAGARPRAARPRSAAFAFAFAAAAAAAAAVAAVASARSDAALHRRVLDAPLLAILIAPSFAVVAKSTARQHWRWRSVASGAHRGAVERQWVLICRRQWDGAKTNTNVANRRRRGG